jgi:hypothetical protein
MDSNKWQSRKSKWNLSQATMECFLHVLQNTMVRHKIAPCGENKEESTVGEGYHKGPKCG